MILIFDTETTGFPFKNLPKDNPAQARIIQLAFLVLDDNFKELSCFKSLVKLPTGKSVSSGAQVAHGISTDQCNKFGEHISNVMPLFNSCLNRADKVVAHNIRFDSQLVDIENQQSDFKVDWSHRKFICTMELMTPICKLASQRQTYKWPKLQEAYQYCFKEDFKGAHDALSDVKATAKVFKWLCDNRHVML